MDLLQRKHHAKILRIFRKIHRLTGAGLFSFFFIVALTSILLGWKKHSNGLLQAENIKGTSSNMYAWKTLDSLKTYAVKALKDSVSTGISTEIDRIEIRQETGMLKFLFKNHYWAIQTDGVTGKTLKLEWRTSDFIEDLHDGSILDKLFNTNSDILRVLYSSLMGLALILFSVTGFWMWFGPKYRRHHH